MAFETIPLRRGFTEIQNLFNLIQGYGFICGGYARYCASPNLNPVPAGDVDVYCYTEQDYKTLLAILQPMFGKPFETGRAVTFQPTIAGPLAFCPQVQLVKPVKEFRTVTVGSMEEILENFDFTIVRAGIVSPTEVLVDTDFMTHEQEMHLEIKNIHCPISSTLRCAKYYDRGYRMNIPNVLKLFVDWEQRDDEYREKIKSGIAYLQDRPAPRNPDEVKKVRQELTAIYDMLSVD